MHDSTDYSDVKYYHLTVIKRSPFMDSKGLTKWECRCDCGKILYMTSYHFLSGNKQSCGCIPHNGQIFKLEKQSAIKLKVLPKKNNGAYRKNKEW